MTSSSPDMRPPPVELNWTWYLLSQHPEAEARLHAEIDGRGPELAGAGARADGSASVHQQVVERGAAAVSAGMAAVAPHHRGGRARRLPGAPGTNVLFAAGTCCKPSPGFWKEPEVFSTGALRPRKATKAERPRFAYMPFAAGPRHCIGETFALYENAHRPPVQGRTPLTASPGCPTSHCNSRHRSTCAAVFPLHMRLERSLMLKARRSPKSSRQSALPAQHHLFRRRKTMQRRCRSASCTRGLGICITCSASAPAAATNSSCSSATTSSSSTRFWAAILGGIVPCGALGISDEHRHKLLRIATPLGERFCTPSAARSSASAASRRRPANWSVRGAA